MPARLRAPLRWPGCPESVIRPRRRSQSPSRSCRGTRSLARRKSPNSASHGSHARQTAPDVVQQPVCVARARSPRRLALPGPRQAPRSGWVLATLARSRTDARCTLCRSPATSSSVLRRRRVRRRRQGPAAVRISRSAAWVRPASAAGTGRVLRRSTTTWGTIRPAGRTAHVLRTATAGAPRLPCRLSNPAFVLNRIHTRPQMMYGPPQQVYVQPRPADSGMGCCTAILAALACCCCTSAPVSPRGLFLPLRKGR